MACALLSAANAKEIQKEIIILNEAGDWISCRSLIAEIYTPLIEAEQQLELAIEAEEDSGEAMDSMERRYWEGVTETYAELYALTYDIAFAQANKERLTTGEILERLQQ